MRILYLYKKLFLMHLKSLFFLLFSLSCSHNNPSKMIKKNQKNTELKKIISPQKLQAGDTVAIIAPAGIIKTGKKSIKTAQSLIESWGLAAVLGANIFEENNHFAGNEEQRLKDIQWALDSPKIKAIWCARGGYGSIRIVDKINFEGFKKNPKWFIGYSDITVIHNQLNNLGYETLHGMMVVNLEEDSKNIKNSIKSLKAGLFDSLDTYEIDSNKANRFGKSKGILIGGNLTLLTSQLGSSTQLDTRNKILFIEEIGEYKYHIDRMLQSLKRAGYFNHCTGVIVGDMMNIKSNIPAWGCSVEELIMNVLEPYDFPVAFGIPAGHMPENQALIFGRSIELSVTESKTKITF